MGTALCVGDAGDDKVDSAVSPHPPGKWCGVDGVVYIPDSCPPNTVGSRWHIP